MKQLVKLKTTAMKTNLYITASFDQPELVENIAEKLASRRYDSRYVNVNIPKQWQAIETSSVENYVSGTVEIACNTNETIKMPFITCFLFSCMKEKSEPYDMIWSVSFN